MKNRHKLTTITAAAAMLLLLTVLLTGCDLSWGGDETAGDETAGDETAGDDILEAIVTGTVVVVDGDDIDVETDTGVVLTATVPAGEIVAIDDRVQLLVTFEGLLVVNWDLMLVEFDRVI